MKKTPSKVRLDYLETFSLTAQPAQTARTVKFMVSNVAYRATVYKAGPSTVHFFVFGLPNMLCTWMCIMYVLFALHKVGMVLMFKVQ